MVVVVFCHKEIGGSVCWEKKLDRHLASDIHIRREGSENLKAQQKKRKRKKEIHGVRLVIVSSLKVQLCEKK